MFRALLISVFAVSPIIAIANETDSVESMVAISSQYEAFCAPKTGPLPTPVSEQIAAEYVRLFGMNPTAGQRNSLNKKAALAAREFRVGGVSACRQFKERLTSIYE